MNSKDCVSVAIAVCVAATISLCFMASAAVGHERARVEPYVIAAKTGKCPMVDHGR